MNDEAASQLTAGQVPAVEATQSLQEAETGESIFQQELLSNELWRWGALFSSIVAGYALGKVLAFVLLRFSDRVASRGRHVYAALLKVCSCTSVIFTVLAGLSFGVNFLLLPAGVEQTLRTALDLLLTLAVGLFAWRLVDVVTEAFRNFAARTDNKMDDMLVPILRTSLRVTVAVFVVVQVIQIFSDKQITSIIAGLGIGGLAVALAAQDSIKNIFGSIIIFADKPFTVGERIVVDGTDGVVEEVGIRSTRLRTLVGHLVTIPNGELANKSIENVGRRQSIRRLMNVTITYDTPPAKVQRAVDIIRELLAVPPGQGGRREQGTVDDGKFPSRVFFNEFNADSLNIIVMYWYMPADYWGYMAYSEWFNFELLRRFNEEGIEFAFPTQTMYLAGDTRRPLDFGPRGGIPFPPDTNDSK